MKGETEANTDPASNPTLLEPSSSSAASFAKFAFWTLIYNLLVIVFGAFVRTSFSGDGCGQNWPLCDGEVIPSSPSVQRLIEFTHRASSGVVLLLTGYMAFWAYRKLAKGSAARKASFYALGFTVSEALLGAGLVKFKWVAHDDSVFRAMAMSAHLCNTLLLLGAITIAWIAAADREFPRLDLKGQGSVLTTIVFGMVCMIALGISGAISALGHTVKPVDDVLAAAANPASHFLNRLQPLHPLIATSVGLYILLLGGMLMHLRPSERVRNTSQNMLLAYGFQFGLGLINIAMGAPAWLQLIHLVSADVAWITLIVASVAALRSDAPRKDVEHFEPEEVQNRPTGKALIKEYVVLTKPKVISLLLFTTLAAMFAAAKGWPGGWLLVGVALGGYMSAGAANAINMVIDRDIDRTMKRTSKRPTVTENISSHHALLFGLVLTILSFALIWVSSNLLAAMLSLAGLVFYVIVYTLMLKRRTWQNIVIGGAAGCFPPLVGWAAVTNNLTPFALVLFAIVFMWTPVHFWALALLIKDDYAAAGIPMLPVVHGDRVTAIQIILYAVLTALVSALPLVQNEAGWLYLGTIFLLNGVLFIRCISLYKCTDRPHAVSLYKFSLTYLFVLFLVVAVDRSFIARPETKGPRKVVSSRFSSGVEGRESSLQGGIHQSERGYGSAI